MDRSTSPVSTPSHNPRRRGRSIAFFATAVLGFVAVGPLASAPTPASAATPVTVQILGINDFHGRIQANQIEAGAAVLAGAVGQLRTQYPDTVFAAAGDLVGASTFESFIQKDKPTIDALNAAGLEVSAVGNHEFDQGYADLTQRIMSPYNATTNPFGGAMWKYLGANVRNADNSPALPESWVKNFGDIQVGFVGAVTDHLSELVSPAGIAGLTIEPPVLAANREADKLKAAGADIVVLLVHEGAADTSLASATDPASDFGKIVTGADANIDAIVSGHTHLTYNHLIPVQQWVEDGRQVTDRPVVSAGQYGYNLDQLLFTVDDDTDQVIGVASNTLSLVTATTAGTPPVTTYTPNYPADPAVATIVSAAVAAAEVPGAKEVGKIGGPFYRGKLANGTTENRGGESTLGNLVAEVQQWATESSVSGSAQIAFMNPGGLRQDMLGLPGAPPVYPAPLTYRQAANVQPFANTLVNMHLTGAQIKTVLEQQWQPAGAARPFLRLGISQGFTYTYDPLAAAGGHIKDMWLNGVAIDPTSSYSVTVNSFLASGGDNFLELAKGTAKHDTGKTDLQAMVDYMAANTPVAVDFTQRSVGVTFLAGAPATYLPGDIVSLNLSSLAFSNVVDLKDTQVALSLGGTSVGTASVDNTIGTAIFDEYGTAAVAFAVPAGTPAGSRVLTITGNITGTTTKVPIVIAAPPIATTTTLSTNRTNQIFGWPSPAKLTATVTAADASVIVGSVEFRSGATVLATVPVSNGRARYTLPSSTPAGGVAVTAAYIGTATVAGSLSAPVTVHVAKAPSITLLRASAWTQRRGTNRPVTLTALVVAPFVGSAGSVQFSTGGAVVATVPVVRGSATFTLSSRLAVGTYRYKATFVPTDSADIAGSTSNAVTVRVRN